MNVRQAIPLLIQEGWTRHQEEAAKPPLTERTGWSRMEPLLRNALRNTSAIPTTPSAPLRWLRIFFLMAQPPLLYQEGSGAPNSSFTPSVTAPTADSPLLGQAPVSGGEFPYERMGQVNRFMCFRNPVSTSQRMTGAETRDYI